jgi:hypothetical protein
MTHRARIAALALALAAVVAAAPSLALAAMACASCCCSPIASPGTTGDCDAALSATSCCDEAPATVPSVAKRNLEGPVSHAVVSQRSADLCQTPRAGFPPRASDLEILVSPLRLSVVLRI